MASSQPKTTIQGLQQPCFTKEQWPTALWIRKYLYRIRMRGSLCLNYGSWGPINYGPAGSGSYLEIVAIGKIYYQTGTGTNRTYYLL